MAKRHSQSPLKIMGDDRLLQSIEARTQAMMAMMQHFIGENRSIGGSQHGKRTRSRTANRSTRLTFREETPALTPDAMVTDIADELRQARNEWNSLPAYVQDR